MEYTFKAKPWLYDGAGAWVFVTLPGDISDEIKVLTSEYRKGFGSVKVKAEVKGISWHTSIFPDKKSGSYLLPIKKEIRTNALISIGKACEFVIQVKDVT